MGTINRLSMIFVALFFLGTGICSADGLQDKSLQQEYKRLCKKMKSEGWKVHGRSRALEAALEAHFVALEAGGDSVVAIVGNGRSKSTNTAVNQAINDAKKRYASLLGSDIDIQRESKEENRNENGKVTTTSTFASDSQTTTKQNVKGFEPTMTVRRTLEDGTIEMQVYYVVRIIK